VVYLEIGRVKNSTKGRGLIFRNPWGKKGLSGNARVFLVEEKSIWTKRKPMGQKINKRFFGGDGLKGKIEINLKGL